MESERAFMAPEVNKNATNESTTHTTGSNDSEVLAAEPNTSELDLFTDLLRPVGLSRTLPPIAAHIWRPKVYLPPIHYLEINKNWLNVRWLLMTMRSDIMNSSYYLNGIDLSRRVYKGATNTLKRLPIR
jgi:hypothetical protein